MATRAPVPSVPPDVLPGTAAVVWVKRWALWLVAIWPALALVAASAFLLPEPWRFLGIAVGCAATAACGLIAGRAVLQGEQRSRLEHAAGYTTMFGGGYRYWQLEPGTGKVLRRPGERTVHRDGIPRALLVREAEAQARTVGDPSLVRGPSAGPYRCPVCGYPDLTAPPRGADGRGSGELCPSCGFAFGVSDDELGYTDGAWRRRWIERGRPWSGGPQRPPPPGWDPAAQLGRLEDAA